MMLNINKKIGDFVVHPIGIGTWAIGGWYQPSYENDKKEIQAIKYSLDKGQNHIDTAEMYADGHAEEVVGQAIKGYKRKSLFIASKVYKNHTSKNEIIVAVEKMLKKLDTEYIDLVYIHSPHNVAPIDVYLEGLHEVVKRGYVKFLGLSKFDLSQLQHALSVSKDPIVALQNLYNVENQSYVDTRLMDFCKKNQITVVAHSPLANCTRLKKVIELAEKYKKTPYQIALQWLIMQGNVVTIPKSTNTSHVDENLGALEFELTREELDSL